MADADTIATIKSQALVRIEEITAQPKPNYMIDGQMVNWSTYMKDLQGVVDWCNERLGAETPFEHHSVGYVP